MGRLVGKALPHQYKYIFSKAKYPALISGLGAGKTEALVYRALKFITEIPKVELGIYQPTVDLTKRILYPRFEDIFANSGIRYKLNKSDGIMEEFMPTGKATLIFRSMDNFTRIIGYQTHHALIDEIDTLSSEKAMAVWIRILARNRKKFRVPNGKFGINTVGVTTTPEGFNFCYNMWVKEHADNPEYELIRGKTADNYHLPEDYVDSLRKTYPPQLVKAYLEGEFVNMKGNTVYDGFDRVLSHTDLTLADFPEGQMINISMDFNISRMAACVIMKNDTGQFFVVDEFSKLMDTPAMIEAIRHKFKGRQITIYPDASVRSRKSVDSSKSDHKLLRDAGFRINAPMKNPPVRDRVLSTNVMFLNSLGERNLFVNTNTCKDLTEALEKQVYDDNSVPVKDGISDDLNDALGYGINRMSGLDRPTSNIVKMRFGV